MDFAKPYIARLALIALLITGLVMIPGLEKNERSQANVTSLECSDTAPQAGLLSYWQAENASGDSAGSNHGTLFGDTSYTTGKVGQAFSFDGTGDYITIPNESNYDFSGQAFTVSGWFKTSTTGATQRLFQKANNSDNQWGLTIRTTNKLDAGFTDSAGNFVDSKVTTNTVTDGAWHHVVAVMNTDTSIETVTLYLDGTEETTTFVEDRATYNYHTGGSAVVSYAATNPGGTPSGYFTGQLDQLRVYDRGLSESEVKALYTAEAGGCGDISSGTVTLSDTTNGNDSNYSIQFTTAGGIGAGESITLRFADDYTLPSALDYTDIDFSSTTNSDMTLGSAPSGSTWGVSVSGQDIVFQSGTQTIPSSDVISIEIGTNATFQSTGVRQITNPSSPGYHTIEVGSTFGEYGELQAFLLGPTCVPTPSGLVSWWPLDGHTSDIEDTNHGTLTNGASFTAGKVAKAADFDGTDDYVSVPYDSSLDITSNLSVVGWIKIDDNPAVAQQALVQEKTAETSAKWMIFTNGTEWRCITDGGVGVVATGVTPTGDWTHLALTRSSGELQCYVNGEPGTPDASPGALASSTKPIIFGRYLGGGFPLEGQVDEVMIFNSVLSAEEVKSIYDAGSAGVCKPNGGGGGKITSTSDTLTRQKIGTASNHTIQFTTPSGIPEDATIEIEFPVGFALTDIIENDVDIADDSTDLTTASDCSGSEEASFTTSDQTLIFTICNGDGGEIAAGSVVEIQIGTNATASGTGTNQIVNPYTEGSYTMNIGGTMEDSGMFIVPIIDDDQAGIKGIIEPVIAFDIDTGTSVGETAAPYSVALGQLSSSTVSTSGGSINQIFVSLDTNAKNGATVSVVGTNAGLNSSNASYTIDTTNSGSPTALSAGVDGFGLCVNATSTVSGASLTAVAPFNGSCDASNHNIGDVTTSSRTILSTTGPSDGTANDSARIWVKAAVGATTPASSDYTETLTFIASGTF